MAYVSRTLFLHSKYFRQCAGGIFASLSSKQNLDFNSLMLSMIKGNIMQSCPRTCTSFIEYISAEKSLTRNKFDELNLPVKSAKVTESQLVNAFLKMTDIYVKIQDKHYFIQNLDSFVSDSSFKGYCRILESKLPRMSPISLVILYGFMDFPGLASDELIDKICVMILEKINEFTVLDKIYIYVKVLKYYSEHKESNNIKKVCEVYFEKCFETDLSQLRYSKEVLALLNIPNLPDPLKRLIAEKLIRDGERRLCGQVDAVKLIEKFNSLSSDVIPKKELKNFIEAHVYEYTSNILLVKISSAYRKLCEADDFFFSKAVLDALIFKCIGASLKRSNRIKIMLDLCLLGYVDDIMINLALDTLNFHQTNFKNLLPVRLLNFLVRSPFLDIHPEATVNSVKAYMANYNVMKSQISFSRLCEFCEQLTYLGFDSRSLCSHIFKMVTENFEATISERNVLSLHHLAKEYFPSGYEVLPEKYVNLLLEAEFKKEGALPSENLNEYFGHEDYVLKNCTTSDKHCLHFVTVFDPDNKPVNLSTFKKQQFISTEQYFNIQEIEKRPGFKTIVFQKFSDPQPIHFINRPDMSGAAKMYLKLFENLNCNIVLLPRKFFKFTPEKRQEFLSSQIKDIIENPKVQAAEG